MAVVALVALPLNAAVIVPALKFPEASLATIVDTVFAEVALEVTVNVVAEPPLKVVEPERPVPEVARVKVFGVLAVTVILVEPLKETPLIVLAVCNVVAVEALPVKAAVIVPALKFPEASLATIVDTVFVVAEFNPSSKSASKPLPVPSFEEFQILLHAVVPLELVER